MFKNCCNIFMVTKLKFDAVMYICISSGTSLAITHVLLNQRNKFVLSCLVCHDITRERYSI